MDQTHDTIVVLGEVVGAHGVRGWLRIRPYTMSTSSLLDYPTWWVKPAGGRWRAFDNAGGRVHANELRVSLDGIGTREAALALNGAEVGVPREALPRLAPGELYWHELIGLTVVNRAGVVLGEVRGVTDHGAHPLLRVATARDGAGPERLIPFVPAIVERVDLGLGRIDVDWESEL